MTETVTVDFEAQLKAIQERLAKAEQENEQLRRDQLNMLMRQPGTAPTPSAPPPPPVLNLRDLPDPVADKDAYAQVMAQRVLEHQRAVAAYEAQAQSTAADAEDRDWALIEAFQTKYPNYSVRKAREIAARVIEEKRRMGWNTDQYVYGMQDQFLTDLAGAYEAQYGKPQAAAQVAQPASQLSPEEQLLRTGSIMGGHESGGAPATAAPAAPVEETVGDILSKAQAKTGLWY